MFCFLVWLVSVQMTVTFWSYRILKKKFYKQSEEVLNWSLIFSSNFRCFFFLLRVRFDTRLCLSFKKKQVLRNPNENNFSSRTEWVTAVITGELVSAFMYIYISSLFYFSFFNDNAKPTCLNFMNSNIYSCILPLLKLHLTFCFMN